LSRFTIERAVERVGAKVRSRMDGQANAKMDRELIRDVPNLSVTAILGPNVVKRVLGNETPEAIMAAEFVALERMAISMTDQAAGKRISALAAAAAAQELWRDVERVGSTV
jgi:hypothetical protein